MKVLATLAKHKLAVAAAAAGVAYYLWRRRQSSTRPCAYADSVRVNGVCMQSGSVDPLFDMVDARDAPIAVDDNGNLLITRPSQL